MDKKMFDFLGCVFACEIEGKPYTHLEHTEEIIKKALDAEYVEPCLFNDQPVIGFTHLGRYEYCQECSRRPDDE